jgi:hypothetical protein
MLPPPKARGLDDLAMTAAGLMNLAKNDQQEIKHMAQGQTHTCLAQFALHLEAKDALETARKIHLKVDFAVH